MRVGQREVPRSTLAPSGTAGEYAKGRWELVVRGVVLATFWATLFAAVPLAQASLAPPPAPSGRIEPSRVAVADQVPAPSATPAQPAPPPPPSTAKIDAGGVLGRTVAGEHGQDIGKIVDVLVDQSGAPRAAVIDFGGFMGVGDRRIAVDWASLKFPASGSQEGIRLALTEDQIKHAPDYKPEGAAPVVVGPPSQAPTPGP